MSEPKFWQINAFSREIDIHFTTVHNWFNLLEDKRVHYVSRATDGKKVYDELDLQIAEYIKSKRNEKWTLESIANSIKEEQETRPFPKDFSTGQESQLAVLEQFRYTLSQELETIVDYKLANVTPYLNNIVKQIQDSLAQQAATLSTALPDPKRARERELSDMLTDKRINMQLRGEALDAWEKLPQSERFIKTGLFSKAEDTGKKDRFIHDYISEHYEKRFKEAFEIE
ncbi:MAG: hypothetical protein K0Q73_7700 [Paenibacillus sp.]|nr:hypothetical protein [Paenibacillus sp.]